LQQRDSPRSKHALRGEKGNKDNGLKSSLQPGISIQKTIRNGNGSRNKGTGNRRGRPSPLAIPTASVKPALNSTIQKSVDGVEQETSTHQQCSSLSARSMMGSECEVAGSAADVEQCINGLEISFSDSDDESSHTFMDTLYYLASFERCSVL
ncbi:hypothetical protein GE061_012321, partial [Apolygus lucorum]